MFHRKLSVSVGRAFSPRFQSLRAFNDSSQPTERTKNLIDGILAGERVALSRGITLVESSTKQDKQQAEILLDRVLAHRKDPSASSSGANTFRIGIAGPPGAGKSTFIETLGLKLAKENHRVAVLAIDPSSSRSGGSILGDKTRMNYLSNHENAFVRPSPTRGALGGVARHTNDIVLLCEAGGYDIVIVESVGVGQSEIEIDNTVDMILLLVPPGGGDELQGSKKGIMEVSDLLVVNKADGALASTAKHTASDYIRACQFVRQKSPNWRLNVKTCSALEKTGIEEVWAKMTDFRDIMTQSGELLKKRDNQSSRWMWKDLQEELMDLVRKDQQLKTTANELKENLVAGIVSPRSAARTLLQEFLAYEDSHQRSESGPK